MPEQPSVSSDRVLEILQREPLGAALLKAAIAEATVEVLQTQLAELRNSSGVSDAKSPGPNLP